MQAYETITASEGPAPATAPNVDVVARRILAFILDAFVLVFVSAAFGRPLTPFHVQLGLSAPPLPFGQITFARPPVPDWPIGFPIVVAYFVLLEALFGLTVGKALAGLRVVTLEGHRPPLRAIALRNALRPIEVWNATLWLGGLVMLASSRHQRIGDMLAGTLVADRRSVPAAGLSRRAARRHAAWCALSAPLAYVGCLAIAYAVAAPAVADHAWDARTGVVMSSDLSLRLPANVGRLVSWTMSAARRDGDMVSYHIGYAVQTTRPRRRYACRAVLRLRWVTELWTGGWRPYDVTNHCLAPAQHIPLNG